MLIYAMFFLSRSDALWHKQTGSSVQHLGFSDYLKYHMDYFVIQLFSEPGKQNVVCLFRRQSLLILSRTQN